LIYALALSVYQRQFHSLEDKSFMNEKLASSRYELQSDNELHYIKIIDESGRSTSNDETILYGRNNLSYNFLIVADGPALSLKRKNKFSPNHEKV
jgi:hypothetical protein